MNRTEWYLTGGLIAAGVVILILLYLIFKRPRSVESDRLLQGPGGSDSPNLYPDINPETGKPYTPAEERELYNELERQFYLDTASSGDDSFNTASSGGDEDTSGSGGDEDTSGSGDYY